MNEVTSLAGTKYLDSSKYLRAELPNSNVDRIKAMIIGQNNKQNDIAVRQSIFFFRNI